jgi:hypothetical protein
VAAQPPPTGFPPRIPARGALGGCQPPPSWWGPLISLPHQTPFLYPLISSHDAHSSFPCAPLSSSSPRRPDPPPTPPVHVTFAPSVVSLGSPSSSPPLVPSSPSPAHAASRRGGALAQRRGARRGAAMAARPPGAIAAPEPRPPSAPPLPPRVRAARPRPCARLWRGGAACLPAARPTAALRGPARGMMRRRGLPARGSARPCARRRSSPAPARPWRPELGRGVWRDPGVPRSPLPLAVGPSTSASRAARSSGARPWPRRGFDVARGPTRLGSLLARLACVACPRQRPAWSARVARPRCRGVARPNRPARVHGAQRATCPAQTPSARPAASLQHPARHARLVHPRLACVGLCGARPTRSRGNPCTVAGSFVHVTIRMFWFLLCVVSRGGSPHHLKLLTLTGLC